MNGQWVNTLPRPIAFVFSGGASLGAIQVGMLRALDTAGIRPDLLVGTSVGALNAAVLADRGFGAGLPALEALWSRIRRSDIFAGSTRDQLRCLLQSGQSLFRQDHLSQLLEETLQARTFAELRIPLGIVATELRSRRRALFTNGDLHPALLASSAIPGLFPSVKIKQRRYVDGCFAANVPLTAAVEMGAASLVVLHTGNRQPSQSSRRLADHLLSALATTLQRQVLRDVPVVAQRLPVVYLPAPKLPPHGLLAFDGNAELMAKTAAHVAHFLATATPPKPGAMCGTLHFQTRQPSTTPQLHARHFDQPPSALAVA